MLKVRVLSYLEKDKKEGVHYLYKKERLNNKMFNNPSFVTFINEMVFHLVWVGFLLFCRCCFIKVVLGYES